MSILLYNTATLRSGYTVKDTDQFVSSIESMMRGSLGIPQDEEVDEDFEEQSEMEENQEEEELKNKEDVEVKDSELKDEL